MIQCVSQVWVQVYNNPRYHVSNMGFVYDTHKDKILAQTPDRAGHLRVKMVYDAERKTVSVHRLIALSFFECYEELEINHIDGNKYNNFIGNLELCTRSENMLHAFNRGLAKPVYSNFAVVCNETEMTFRSTEEADRYLEVSYGSVSKHLRGLQPTVRGYTFSRLS